MKLLRLSASAALFIIGLQSQESYAAKQKLTPEQEASRIAKRLKPIPDEDWKNIAGPKASEKYSISKGDTLSDVSKRLFGDPKYWPKIWALNNDSITNPHKILPGNTISFLPGTGTSLPSVSVAANSSSQNSDSKTATDAPKGTIPSKGRSMEWKNLPRQSWELYKVELPPEADPLGFDKRSKIHIQRSTGFEPQAVPATERLQLIGQIIGSRSEGMYLGINDTVYIVADQSIQVGETYAITKDPGILKSPKSDRVGYSYLTMGKVKILGVRDSLFVGKILTARHFIPRGSMIMPLPARVPDLTPIPGPHPIQGILMLDHEFSTYTTAQHKEVFIDRGAEDGVKQGMVFRAYEHFDPSNNKRLTNSEFIIDADIIVTQVSSSFSSGVVIRSTSPVMESSTVILLTDVSDLLNNTGFNDKGGKADDLEDLDKLDDSDSLGKDEKRELKQLETWKGNPSKEDAPPPPPGTSPDGTPPPPTADTMSPPPPPGDTPPSDSGQPPTDAPPPPPPDGAAPEGVPPPPDTVPPPPAPDAATSSTSLDIPPPPPPGDAPAGAATPSSTDPGGLVPAPPAGGAEPPPPPPPPPGS